MSVGRYGVWRTVRAFDFFYLDERVDPVEDRGDGWVLFEWLDGRRWWHWLEQVRSEPLWRP